MGPLRVANQGGDGAPPREAGSPVRCPRSIAESAQRRSRYWPERTGLSRFDASPHRPQASGFVAHRSSSPVHRVVQDPAKEEGKFPRRAQFRRGRCLNARRVATVVPGDRAGQPPGPGGTLLRRPEAALELPDQALELGEPVGVAGPASSVPARSRPSRPIGPSSPAATSTATARRTSSGATPWAPSTCG